MGQDQPVKALVVAFAGEPAAAVYVIHRLRPEALCFVLPEPAKTLVETEVQPNVEQMPKRWDWVTLPEPDDDVACHRMLGPLMSDVLRTWEVQPSELVVDLTGATPAIAGALTLVTLPVDLPDRLAPSWQRRPGERDHQPRWATLPMDARQSLG